MFKSWEQFREITSYWGISENVHQDMYNAASLALRDEDKISQALKVMRLHYVCEGGSLPFKLYLEEKIKETQMIIDYYKVNHNGQKPPLYEK